MPLTAAERAKRFVEKLKTAGRYEDYKKNRAIWAKNNRQNEKKKLALPTKKNIRRANEKKVNSRLRVQNYRQNQKAKLAGKPVKSRKTNHQQAEPLNAKNGNFETASASHNQYELRSSKRSPKQVDKVYGSSKLAFRKAVSRARAPLPKSIGKRKEVVTYIYESLFDVPKPKIARFHGISDELRKSVISFYERDDISRQSPGRKDYVKIKDALGNKVKIQVKYLMYPVREVYKKYCSANIKVELQLKSFFRLRPKHILPVYQMPHNVCLCTYHANFTSAVNALNQSVPDFPKYGDEFYKTFFCSDMTRECWSNSCKNCKDGFLDVVQGVGVFEKDRKTMWYQWQEIENRQVKVQYRGKVQELALYLSEIGPSFLEHAYAKRAQEKSYQKCLADAKTQRDIAVIQIDFAENYKCIAQDEISSAHWNQNQISIFTVALWIGDTMKSYALVSDDLDHSKSVIIPYIDRLFEELPKHIKKVHVWSDGPTSQFKNKFIAASIHTLESKYKFTLDWNFFATGHGKGPVDGIGGALKRDVWTNVKSRKNMVHNAEEFIKAVDQTSLVKIILMDTPDIEQRTADLGLKRVWDTAKAVQGIMKFHNLRVCNGKVVGFRTTSGSEISLIKKK